LDYLVLVNSDIKAASRCSGSWSDMQSARLWGQLRFRNITPHSNCGHYLKFIKHTDMVLISPKQPSSEPHGATRQYAIAKTPAKWSAYKIPSVIVVFVVLVCKVQCASLIDKSHKRPWTYQLQRSATEHSSTRHCMFLHNLPNVLVQITNKMGLQKTDTS
jgi:hypothetical protein